MQFTKKLREPIRRGFITTTIRIWQTPRVKVGGRYKVEDRFVIVDSFEEISLNDITTELAVESGFESRADLLAIAKHGVCTNVYLIHFHYEP